MTSVTCGTLSTRLIRRNLTPARPLTPSKKATSRATRRAQRCWKVASRVASRYCPKDLTAGCKSMSTLKRSIKGYETPRATALGSIKGYSLPGAHIAPTVPKSTWRRHPHGSMRPSSQRSSCSTASTGSCCRAPSKPLRRVCR